MQTTNLLHWLLLMTLSAGLLGCAGNRQPTRFYLLEPAATAKTDSQAMSDAAFVLGVGPLHFPDYLNRPQIVVGTTSVEVKISEYHRWAERLEDNFTRVLTENLTAFYPNARILSHPWRRRFRPDLTVAVHVLRFHSDPQGVSRLTARWSIARKDRILLDNQSNIAIPGSDSDYEAMVRAQSLGLAALSREIASALRAYTETTP